MVRIYQQSNDETAYKTDFICSSIADVPDLPTTCDPGSTALVPDGGILTVYMLSPERVWEGPY